MTKAIKKQPTKKQRIILEYAKAGILANTFGKSDTIKIYHPVLGWINELMIDGNSKIGRGVWHFSTLAGAKTYTAHINGAEYELRGTCPFSCPGCYAMTGHYNQSSVVDANGVKTWLVYNDLEYVQRAISAQMKAYEIKLVRIHASGEFFSDEYINMWIDIAAAFPDVFMWSYTKVKAAEAAFENVQNINIVKSLIPGKGFNFGHCDYILALYDYLTSIGKSVYICRCGVDRDQHCTNCKGCSKYDYVLFIEHSTDYKAADDPLFPVLKALIESQDKSIAA